jgi:hypothetical protein
MNKNSTPVWNCSGCGEAITDVCEPRHPCAKCGSTARTAALTLVESVDLKDYTKTHWKHRESGRKVVLEVISGDDYHRTTGKWNVMHRRIDRKNDQYEETFRDRETGHVLHHNEEPLSMHRKAKRDV